MRTVLTLICAVLCALPLAAQDRAQSLADIRQELTILYVDIQRLKQELSTTGAATGVGGGGSTLDRVNAIEGALTRLTAKTEELEFRIDQIVRDGTNRIGDLEFRLVELEGGDISQLAETTTLGGGTAPTTPVVAPSPQATGPQLATAEQADFDRAKAQLDAGEYAAAADGFTSFVQTYPGGPLTVEAQVLRGQALAGTGQENEAARAYLAAFSADPAGPLAPQAVLYLGRSLGQLGQLTEACITLAEVGNRYPTAPEVNDAAQAMSALNCG